MKAKQQRIQQILSETIMALCNNGLEFDCELEIDGLLGITLDKKDVFLVKISEIVQGGKSTLSPKPQFKDSASELTVENDLLDNNSMVNVPAKRLCTQLRTNRSPKRKKPEDDDNDDNASPQDLSQRTHSPCTVKQELFSNADSNHRDSSSLAASVVRIASPAPNSFSNNSHWRPDQMDHEDNSQPKPAAAHASSTASAPNSAAPRTPTRNPAAPPRSFTDVAACGWYSPGFVRGDRGDSAADSSPPLPFTTPTIKTEVAISAAEEMLAENGHFPCRLPPKRNQQSRVTGGLSMQKRCRVCYRSGMRKETIYCCPKCAGVPGLCSGRCFALYHGLLYDDHAHQNAQPFLLLPGSPRVPPQSLLASAASSSHASPNISATGGKTDIAPQAMQNETPQPPRSAGSPLIPYNNSELASSASPVLAKSTASLISVSPLVAPSACRTEESATQQCTSLDSPKSVPSTPKPRHVQCLFPEAGKMGGQLIIKEEVMDELHKDIA